MSGFWSGFFQKKDSTSPIQRRTVVVSQEGPVDQSLRDAVTGLYNRKHLLHRLTANMARCLRSKEKMAVILWDIDGFVDFNNRFGQAEGNLFLKKVSDSIRRSIRSYDEAFRSGPDEFCAILIPADEKKAHEVTERVRRAVSKDLFQGEAEYANHEFSISAGCIFPSGENPLAESILYEVGQSLYQNRIKKTSSKQSV